MKRLVCKTVCACMASIMLLSVCYADNDINNKGDTMNPLDNKPMIMLSIDGIGCYYNIRINDIPVEYSENHADAPNIFTMPINQYLTSDKNTISIEAQKAINAKKLASHGQQCKVSAQVVVSTAESDKEYPVGTLSYESQADHLTATDENIKGTTQEQYYQYSAKQDDFIKSDSGEIYFGQPEVTAGDVYYGWDNAAKTIQLKDGVKTSNSFNIPMPINALAFLSDAETIADNEQTKQELLAQYQKIWDAIKAKDIEALKSMFSYSTERLMKTLYAPRKEIDPVPIMQQLINSNAKVIIPNKDQLRNIHMNVFGNDRLVALTRWNSAPAIFFNKGTGGSTDFPITFARINGKWEIVF